MSAGKRQSEATWEGQPGHDRVESWLVAGYVVVALIAVIHGARAKIGEGLSSAVPDSTAISPHTFLPSVLDLLQNGADFVAAVGLLLVSGLILYRRRRNRLKHAVIDPPAQQRFDLPFLF
jgi:hypothetical protein